jgi:nonsense-mediated mRNA decay protein 3
MLLRDVEEDTELRSTLALYKSKQADKPKAQPGRMEGIEDDIMNVANGHDDGDDSDGLPKINMDELLDDFEELNVND